MKNKKLVEALRIIAVVILLSPLAVAWIPSKVFTNVLQKNLLEKEYNAIQDYPSVLKQTLVEKEVEVLEQRAMVISARLTGESEKLASKEYKRLVKEVAATGEASAKLEAYIANLKTAIPAYDYKKVESDFTKLFDTLKEKENESLKSENVSGVHLPIFVEDFNQKAEEQRTNGYSVHVKSNGAQEKIEGYSFYLQEQLKDPAFEETKSSFRTLVTYLKETEENYRATKAFIPSLLESFKELSLTLVTTLLVALIFAILLGYVSVLWLKLGRFLTAVNNAIESVPSVLIALFLYAPVSSVLAKSSSTLAKVLSVMVFIIAAILTLMPEAVRSISIPLSDLYDKKYSVSFRSYGFTKNRILKVLMKMDLLKSAIKRVAAGILLKTLVLDTSLGYIIQIGYGSDGTPAHASPGALIAAHRKTLSLGGINPEFFWIPTIILIAISVACLLLLKKGKEEA